ncbi:MAG TPA: hypothetical protein VF843_02730 [Streptosporangiaceae bacterium]
MSRCESGKQERWAVTAPRWRPIVVTGEISETGRTWLRPGRAGR